MGDPALNPTTTYTPDEVTETVYGDDVGKVVVFKTLPLMSKIVSASTAV